MQPWNLVPARDLALPLHDRLLSLRRESDLLETLAQLGWWTVMRGYLKLCHGLRVYGRRRLPVRPPFVLVANHASHLDTLVLGSLLKEQWRNRTFPLAAGDMFFDSPRRALFAAGLLNALPLWRGQCTAHAVRELRQRLIDEECIYILFPEGTRSRDGCLNPFQPGLGMLVAETGVPVVPCYLHGTFDSLPPGRFCPRYRKVGFSIGKPLRFADVGNDRAGWTEIARRTEQRIRLLGSLTGTRPGWGVKPLQRSSARNPNGIPDRDAAQLPA
jgi:1-acyl-sn-glycerol-3-phosphate acyltransferase